MDFFALSKVLPALLYPLPLTLLALFILGLCLPKLGRRSWLKAVLVLLPVVLWTVSTPLFSRWLGDQWEEPRRSLADLQGNFDAAIVLGGLSIPDFSTPEHTEFNDRPERLLEAINLYRQGRVAKIMITSGSGDLLNPDLKEAPALKQAALNLGVPEKDLVIEDQSRNTWENGLFSQPIAQAAGWKRVLLITSAFHQKRSNGIFKKQGWNFEPWPVDTQATRPSASDFLAQPWALGNTQVLLKEMAGYVVYQLNGYL